MLSLLNFPQLGKSRFHKSQAFDFKEDLAVANLGKPGIGGKLLLGQSGVKNTSVYPKGLGGDKPAWVAFDKQVWGEWEEERGGENSVSTTEYILLWLHMK